MSKLPLLGVICNRRAHDGGTHQSVNHTYLDAISAWMNVQPLLIPANRTFTNAQAADNLLSAVDGLLVTGNRSNVHPKNYGGTETPEHPPFDTARDTVSLELIKRALSRNMPTLAICRGLQELNVACGGSLTAGLSGQKNKLDHRTIEAEDHDTVYRARHGVTFIEDGWWHKLTDRT
ncbi:MAG: gamma-glutamyl-gamma-aminobutyrate hydrolase family protein, partial [Pseudomonadota bacterium]|nr:gamma-glutamyl-gamma-aminobutyrate hydrolase family protein [Pseudomonadota bacterium]